MPVSNPVLCALLSRTVWSIACFALFFILGGDLHNSHFYRTEIGLQPFLVARMVREFPQVLEVRPKRLKAVVKYLRKVCHLPYKKPKDLGVGVRFLNQTKVHLELFLHCKRKSWGPCASLVSGGAGVETWLLFGPLRYVRKSVRNALSTLGALSYQRQCSVRIDSGGAPIHSTGKFTMRLVGIEQTAFGNIACCAWHCEECIVCGLEATATSTRLFFFLVAAPPPFDSFIMPPFGLSKRPPYHLAPYLHLPLDCRAPNGDVQAR